MMSQEQLKVDYWSVIVKLSYSVANYVITAQQSSWSQITDCCFFFVISLESLGSLLAHFTDLQVKVRDLPRCVRVVEEVAVQDQASTLVLDCRWWEHLSNWILKLAPCHVDLSKQPSSLLPTKAVFPFSHSEDICSKLLAHSPSLLLTAVIQGRHKMKLPSPCGARIWKPFSCFLCLQWAWQNNLINLLSRLLKKREHVLFELS